MNYARLVGILGKFAGIWHYGFKEVREKKGLVFQKEQLAINMMSETLAQAIKETVLVSPVDIAVAFTELEAGRQEGEQSNIDSYIWLGFQSWMYLNGDDDAIKECDEADLGYSKELYLALLVENHAHCDSLKANHLPQGDPFIKLLDVVRTLNTESEFNVIAVTTMLSVLLEFAAEELERTKIARRIINAEGFHEFVAFNDPRQSIE